MTKALTQEEFIEKAKAVHGDSYDYSKAKYIRSSIKITVTCPKDGHGDWEVTPNNHLKRKCPKCACSFTNARDAFIPKAKEIHGDVYDYTSVEYVSSVNKVKIKCKVHDFFFVTPSNHLNGIGCAKCSYEKMAKKKTKSQEQYIEEVKEIHGDKYDLSKIVYTHSLDKVNVRCTKHGDFSTQAHAFLQGHGCPSCMEGGYNQMKPGTLYVMQSQNVTKVGITNQTSEQRAVHINKTTQRVFDPVFSITLQDGRTPLTIETSLLREMRKNHKAVEEKFNGSTECFYDVDIQALLNRIEELIEEHSYAPNRLVDTNRETAL